MHGYTAEVVPHVTLTHNLGDDGVAYDRQRATFICMIVAGQDIDIVITWSSDEYIGTGGIVLQLTSADSVGSNKHNPRDPTTVVTMINTMHSQL